MLIDNLVTSTTYNSKLWMFIFMFMFMFIYVYVYIYVNIFMFSFAPHKLNALHIVFWIWSYFKFQQTDHIFKKNCN